MEFKENMSQFPVYFSFSAFPLPIFALCFPPLTVSPFLSFIPSFLSTLPPGHVSAGGGGNDGGVPIGRPPANPAVNHEQEPIAGGGKGSTLSAVHRGDHC